MWPAKPSVKARRLIQVTHDSLMKGIEAVRPGATFGDIGWAIQSYVEANRMSVVRDFCGHGLGRVFHAPPNVLHFGRPGKGPVLEEGMFFTIEPMVNLGRPETKVLADDWTAVTRDKSLSAQFEHSIGVTATGFEIFTLSPEGKVLPRSGLSRTGFLLHFKYPCGSAPGRRRAPGFSPDQQRDRVAGQEGRGQAMTPSSGLGSLPATMRAARRPISMRRASVVVSRIGSPSSRSTPLKPASPSLPGMS
jgi:hypothetical protein